MSLPEVDTPKKSFNSTSMAVVIIAIIVLVFYARLNTTGNIWWSDAARNALNGAFVLDLIKTMPIHDPVNFAYDYYRQWPALTILFYPPLFYGVTAIIYAVFGVSESSVTLTACLFLFGLGWGAFRLSSRWLPPRAALAAAILTIGVPEFEFWGQQPMLDVPSYALLMWSAVYVFRYIDSNRRNHLIWSVVFFVLSIYTKYNSAFFAPALIAIILMTKGWKVLLSRDTWQALIVGVILMVPLIAIFFTFSRYNLEQAASVPTITTPRWSVDSWLFYARAIPASVTWPVLGLSVVYLIATALWRRLRIPTPDAVFLIAWASSGYAFYSIVAVKEPRYDLFLVYPIVITAVIGLERALQKYTWHWLLPLGLAVAVLVNGQIIRPAPYVTGMREAADRAAELAPKDTNVAFWGRWDGSFIFDMRAYEGRSDVGILRLDKLLLGDVVVSFELGFKDKGLTTDQILEALRQYHVQYVVFQTEFRNDIPSVRTLGELLQSGPFELVKTIPITANYNFSSVTKLEIYRFTETVPAGRVLPPIQIKLLGKSLS